MLWWLWFKWYGGHGVTPPPPPPVANPYYPILYTQYNPFTRRFDAKKHPGGRKPFNS